VLVAAGVVGAAAVISVWTLAPRSIGWRPVSPGLASAVRACPGHLFNGYDTGAALIWWAPDTKVFVDNRQDPYPAAVIDSLFGLTRTSYREVFSRYDISCALTENDKLLGRFLAEDGWRATYVGETASVWVSPSVPLATTATE
jgi:hypothetical protein